MNVESVVIQRQLALVEAERARRAHDAALAGRVHLVKAFQHERFEKTYSDLLAQPRYASAARFFLEDLYGPYDFSERDSQFARIVPGLVRLFPSNMVATVASLAELHALSETLDTEMALQIDDTPLDAARYRRAWQSVGRPADRQRQIDLMLRIGRALESYTANPLLRHSLRVMRRPARAAGLGALQAFLERGFDTFREMNGADEFLRTIAKRESELAAELFHPD